MAENTYFFIPLFYIVLWYIIGSKYIIRKRGLDPTLITYLSPLCWRNYWCGRILVITAICATMILPHASVIISEIVLLFALSQILCLSMFERIATQPVVNYVLIVMLCTILITQPAHYVFMVLILILASEYTYFKWKFSRKERYHNWVSRKAIIIHKKYAYLSATVSPKEWFCILHIATTESIARPKLVRIAERLYYKVKHPTSISTGIMQVQSAIPMSDLESMQVGIKFVTDIISTMPSHLTGLEQQLRWISLKYNGSTKYSRLLLETYPGIKNAWTDIMSVR